MQTLESVTEPYVVAKFLEAEYSSPRFSKPILAYIEEHNLSKKLITSPNLLDESENLIRGEILNAARGYIDREHGSVFEGLPNRVQWSRVAVPTSDLGKILMCTYPAWQVITRNTRLLSQAADYLTTADPEGNPARFVLDFLAKFDPDTEYPPIILLTDNEESRYVLLEGAVRAISHWVLRDRVATVAGILGKSENMDQYHDF